MTSLNQKRAETLKIIIQAAGIGGTATAAPTPTAEVPVQIVLGVADLAMCLKIWDIYFNEEIDEKSIVEIITSKGIILAAAGGTGYVIARGATGLLHEALNILTLPGWVASGLIAASATVTLALGWMIFCDNRYRGLISSNSTTSPA